jgi:hypothetical protein
LYTTGGNDLIRVVWVSWSVVHGFGSSLLCLLFVYSFNCLLGAIDQGCGNTSKSVQFVHCELPIDM